MTRLRGVCTRADGGVTIIIPADQCIKELATGGGIVPGFQWREAMTQWVKGFASARDITRWWRSDEVPMTVAVEWEVHKLLREQSWRPDRSDREYLARRWVMCRHVGGLSERDAVALILEKDAPAWSTAHEIVDMDELPKDRTFRNAWRRSSNGGPIWIDDAKAEQIMWERYDGARTA